MPYESEKCQGLVHIPQIVEYGRKKIEHFHEGKVGDLCTRHRTSIRSDCRFCSKSSITTKCSHCDVYLCLQCKDGEQNCWEKWHRGYDVGGVGSD